MRLNMTFLRIADHVTGIVTGIGFGLVIAKHISVGHGISLLVIMLGAILGNRLRQIGSARVSTEEKRLKSD